MSRLSLMAQRRARRSLLAYSSHASLEMVIFDFFFINFSLISRSHLTRRLTRLVNFYGNGREKLILTNENKTRRRRASLLCQEKEKSELFSIFTSELFLFCLALEAATNWSSPQIHAKERLLARMRLRVVTGKH
jgi:hypothetical protein